MWQQAEEDWTSNMQWLMGGRTRTAVEDFRVKVKHGRLGDDPQGEGKSDGDLREEEEGHSEWEGEEEEGGGDGEEREGAGGDGDDEGGEEESRKSDPMEEADEREDGADEKEEQDDAKDILLGQEGRKAAEPPAPAPAQGASNAEEEGRRKQREVQELIARIGNELEVAKRGSWKLESGRRRVRPESAPKQVKASSLSPPSSSSLKPLKTRPVSAFEIQKRTPAPLERRGGGGAAAAAGRLNLLPPRTRRIVKEPGRVTPGGGWVWGWEEKTELDKLGLELKNLPVPERAGGKLVLATHNTRLTVRELIGEEEEEDD
eukprot:762107-Hanusia_phi.AAC.2